MGIAVVYGANVRYPSALRDLLIRLAQAGSVQARWTHRILDETFASLARNRPDLDPSRLRRTRELMVRAVRDCLEAVDLPDPTDRHVLAAAIKARAHIVVTWNVKDFPAECAVAWDVEAKDRMRSFSTRSTSTALLSTLPRSARRMRAPTRRAL